MASLLDGCHDLPFPDDDDEHNEEEEAEAAAVPAYVSTAGGLFPPVPAWQPKLGVEGEEAAVPMLAMLAAAASMKDGESQGDGEW